MVLTVFVPSKTIAAPETPALLEIGVSESLLPGIPDWMRGVVTDPFMKLIKEQSGHAAHTRFLPDGLAVGKALDEGKLHFGIFYGNEFGWSKARYPKLTAFAVSVTTPPCQAFLLVRADRNATTIAEFAKDNLSLPPIQRPYSAMFLAKQKREHLKGADFPKTVIADTAVDAVFDVLERRSGCAVVDALTLKFFEQAHPGVWQQLRILTRSEVFPSPCIAIKANTLDPKMLEKIKATLLKADTLPSSKGLLRVWHSKGFVEPTEAFLKACGEIAEKYPPPGEKK